MPALSGLWALAAGLAAAEHPQPQRHSWLCGSAAQIRLVTVHSAEAKVLHFMAGLLGAATATVSAPCVKDMCAAVPASSVAAVIGEGAAAGPSLQGTHRADQVELHCHVAGVAHVDGLMHLGAGPLLPEQNPDGGLKHHLQRSTKHKDTTPQS